ncbi:MAG: endonuclease/exonuclease/phosphatase family protein, partial [Thermodesulfobacteriota bacterium]
ITREWRDKINELQTLLPHRITRPRSDNFGIAIYSKYPLVDGEILRFGGVGVPGIVAKITVAEREISLVTVHTLPPASKEYLDGRNKQLTEAALFMKDQPAPKILVGDLNVTMFSGYYKDFVRKSGLTDCRIGFGTLPTWPVDIPAIMIPIDHCFASKDMKVLDIYRTDPIGSDHLPLVMKFAL